MSGKQLSNQCFAALQLLSGFYTFAINMSPLWGCGIYKDLIIVVEVY